MSTADKSNDQPIPFGQEFTPTTLGKTLGEDNVLPWLLSKAAASPKRVDFASAIQSECLSHIVKDEHRRDMASHVVTSLKAYRLIDLIDDDKVALTDVGAKLHAASEDERYVLFARHILTTCNGQRLVDAVLRYQLRGEKALLEDLARELGLNPTDKSISAMRAWLSLAGVFPKSGYSVEQSAVANVLGSDVGTVYGLSNEEFQFVVAVRILESQTGDEFVSGPMAITIAEERNPGIRLPRKAFGNFVKSLADRGVVESKLESGAGGSFHSIRLLGSARELTEDQLRLLLQQSKYGFALHELDSLSDLFDKLDEGSTYELGQRGEMLAVHICLAIGLRVVAWRSRAPAAEIDLIAERVVGHAYQRWAVQVKNTKGNLDIDRVDREVGASVGTGITHVLFVVPRAGLTDPARAEIIARSRLSSLHIYYLTKSELSSGLTVEPLLESLSGQARSLEFVKSEEATRREG